jgi:hypothetical protein
MMMERPFSLDLKPGTMAASPAVVSSLSKLSEPTDLVWPVSELLSEESLAYPSELIAILQVDPDASELPLEDGHFQASNGSVDSGISTLLPVVGSFVLFGPAFLLLWMAYRVAAEHRSRVYRTMSISGVEFRHLRQIVALEGTIFGFLGAVLGLLLFVATLVAVTLLTSLGESFFVRDLFPSWSRILTVLAIPPVMSALASVLVCRRVAGQRQLTLVQQRDVSIKRAAPLLAGLASLALAGLAAKTGPVPLLIGLELVGLSLLLIGSLTIGALLLDRVTRVWLRLGKRLNAGWYLAGKIIRFDVRRSYSSVAGISLVALIFGFVLPLVQPTSSASDYSDLVMAPSVPSSVATEVVTTLGGPGTLLSPVLRTFGPSGGRLVVDCQTASSLGLADPCVLGPVTNLDQDQRETLKGFAADELTLATASEILSSSSTVDLLVLTAPEAPQTIVTITAVRRALPAADIMPVRDLFTDVSDEREMATTLQLLFTASVLLGGSALVLSVVTEVTQRQTLQALLGLIGFKRSDRNRLVVSLLALPALIGVVPALLSGGIASVLLARSLGGGICYTLGRLP